MSGGKKAITRRIVRQRSQVAKFLEREDLSETEINKLSDYSISFSDSSFNSDVSDDSEDASESSRSSQSSSCRKESSKKQTKKNIKGKKEKSPRKTSVIRSANIQKEKELSVSNLEVKESKILPLSNSVTSSAISSFDPLFYETTEFANLNQNAAINFQQFSTQLYSRYASLLQDQQSFSANKEANNEKDSVDLKSSSASSSTYEIQYFQSNKNNTEEFIDNKIYKFILNGKRGLDVPPRFEVDTKEALENEELAKKLATFQIETDTEMSIFNTDDNTSNSSQSEIETSEAAIETNKK